MCLTRPRQFWATLTLALLLLPAGIHAAEIDLSGAWLFQLDNADTGVNPTRAASTPAM